MKRRSKNIREKNQKAEEAPTKGKGKGAREQVVLITATEVPGERDRRRILWRLVEYVLRMRCRE